MGSRFRLCRGCLLSALVPLAAWPAYSRDASTHGELCWDTYGVPHIYGDNVLAVVRGLGYAEMENQAETLLTNIASARGRSAEYFGPGKDDANVASDIKVRTEGIPARAKDWLDRGGAFQRAVIKAFTQGANEYAARHGDTIDPAIRRVLPLVPTDVTAAEQYTINFNFMPEQDNLPGLIESWRSGGIVAANTRARSLTPSGSNGWAIGPRKSTTGNAILMGNPHLPWGNNQPIPGLGIYQFMQVNLVVGDPAHPSLNASGVVTVGSPFLGIGYTDRIGWTHTNNTIQNANLYEISIAADYTYRFGHKHLPLLHRTDLVKVRRPDGSLASRPIDIEESIHGPIVARRGDRALALRVAGLDQPSLVTQYWRMIEAHGLRDFIAADAMLQMPFFNVIYADRDGHVMYVFGGRQPLRGHGDWGDYDGILDGGDPSLLWTRTFAWSALPRVVDPPGGFVANANDPPWTSSFPEVATNDPAHFPAYFSPRLMDFRPQHAMRFLLSQPRFTTDDLLAGKEQTDMLLAERVLPDLIAAARRSGDRMAAAAAAALAAWNGKADAGSRGAVLFERWWTLVAGDPAIAKDSTIGFFSPHPRFRVGWRASAPLDTPAGLADASSCVPDLVKAAEAVKAQYGSLDIPWGAVHKTVLVTHDKAFATAIPVSQDPTSGPADRFGPIRVVDSFPAPDRSGAMLSYGGDSYVQLVEFTPHGAQARALLGYGNSSRPGSSHITDMLPAFDAKTLLPVWRRRADVKNHTERVEKY